MCLCNTRRCNYLNEEGYTCDMAEELGCDCLGCGCGGECDFKEHEVDGELYSCNELCLPRDSNLTVAAEVGRFTDLQVCPHACVVTIRPTMLVRRCGSLPLTVPTAPAFNCNSPPVPSSPLNLLGSSLFIPLPLLGPSLSLLSFSSPRPFLKHMPAGCSVETLLLTVALSPAICPLTTLRMCCCCCCCCCCCFAVFVTDS
jgi:hypothetical protein